jgi:hypothetical protein
MQMQPVSAEPPKGVPTDLLSSMETLRWLRSAFGELKSWPDGKLKSSFHEGLLLLADSNVLPLRDQLDSLQRDKEYLLEQVDSLKLSCDNLREQLSKVNRSQPQAKVEVVYKTVFRTPWKRVLILLVVVAFLAFLSGLGL